MPRVVGLVPRGVAPRRVPRVGLVPRIGLGPEEVGPVVPRVGLGPRVVGLVPKGVGLVHPGQGPRVG